MNKEQQEIIIKELKEKFANNENILDVRPDPEDNKYIILDINQSKSFMDIGEPLDGIEFENNPSYYDLGPSDDESEEYYEFEEDFPIILKADVPFDLIVSGWEHFNTLVYKIYLREVYPE